MYKLIIKLLEIKNQSKRYKEPPKKKTKTKTHLNLTKSEKKFTKRWVKRVYDPPHLNCIMSSLGVEEPQPRTKIKRK